MARFKILSKDGATTRYEGKPRYIGSYLRPSYLEFSEIASDKPIAWEVGDYVEYSRTGMRYYLYSIPQMSKNARSGSHGKAFSYSNVQFHAASKDLEIAPFRDIVPNDNGVHFSSSPEVATFEDVYGIARRIQACMDEIYPGKWQILVTSFDSVEDADIYDLLHTPKNFALSGGTCLDALSKIYELWGETGWYHFYYSVNGMNVIMIGYSSRAVGSNTVAGFYYGKGKGLTAIKKTQINKDELATRLYVYGSERNLPLRWYNGLNIANAESVDIRNLMLPLDRWGKTNGLPDARKAYLENAEAVAKYGIIPKSHYFDSDDAGADLYPTIEGMTVGMVRKALADMGESKYVPTSVYSDSERVDEVFASSPTVDNGVLKKNGAEHNYTEGVTYAGATTPMVTIAKGTDEETAIVENHLLYQSDVALDKVYRAKVTASADLACRVPDKGFSIVRGELRLDSTPDGTEPKGKMDVFFHLDEEKREWVLDIPNISADYVDASYVRYRIYLTLSVYVTPKEALSSDVTTNMAISEGGIDIIIDQIFDKTFSLSLKQIGFNIAERAALGEGKVISMKSGMCEGRNFVIKTCRFVESNDTWRIECARQKDDNLGMLFPNTDYQIKAGDRFVLLDIAMPDTYIYANMERVYTEGMKLLEKASKVQYHYEPVIDAKVMAESEKAIREGMFLEFVDDDIIDTTFVRLVIDSLNIYEDESAIPTYRVTLKEKKKVSYKGTPSATSETKTSSYGDENGNGGSVDIDLTDYATKEWVREQKYTTEEWTNQQGFLKSIEGSDFVEYNEGKVSLVLDEQGGLGERGQGLGIVSVPQDALEDSLKTINGQSIVGKGNIVISSAPTGDFVTKDELIAEIGEAYPIYLAPENDEQKEANRAAIAAYVAAEVKPVLYPYGETRATAPFSVLTHEMEDGIEAIIQYRIALGAEPTMGEAYYLIMAKVNKDGSVEIQNDAPADYVLPTEEYVKEMVGESYPVYTPLDAQQELTEEQKAVNKDTYDAVVAAWDADVSQMPYLYLYDLGKQFPCLVFDVFADEGYIEIYTNVDALPGDLADFGLGLIGSGLLSFSNHIYLHSDGSVTDNGSNLFLSPDIFTVKDMMSEEERILYVSNANGSITAAQQEYNKETFTKIEQGRKLRLVIPILGIPAIHSYWDGKVIFTIQFVVQGSLFLGQGALLSDGSYEYEEFEFGQGGGTGGGGVTTETDPVFQASPAAQITQADIARWNNNTGGGSVTVDPAMSDTSANPVQNKVITKAISDIEERVSNMEDFFGEGANLTLSIKSNQGTDETISAVKATIKYDGQSMESGSGIIGLPAFTSIQIIFPDVEGYKTPAPISFDTNGHPISYSVTYETEIVNVNLSAWDGASVNGQIVTINGKNYTWDGNDIQHKVAFGVEYWVYANDKSGYVIKGDKFVASQTNRTVSLVYNGVAGSFITIDQNIADSATRVSGDINGEHIQLIRNNSHRYLGKYTSDGTMTLCQLDDDDSHYYSDGSEAVLTGSQGDVFMKLPRFFYTVNERRPDVWSIGFYYGNSAPSSAWVEWDGNELIGVFKLSSSARSIAYDSSYGLSKDTYSSRAAARGNGYSLIKWKHHGIMAVLYFALYGNTNSQAVIGAGLGAGNRQCGSTSSLGMTDTVASETAINFWGLENWWGAGYEFFENVTFLYDTWTWKIVEDDGTIRELTARGYSNYLGKCYIGVHLDFVERPDSTETYSATTGYCDYIAHYMSSANERVMERGANVTGDMGILAMHTIIDSSTATNGNYEGGSRICFRGTIIINNDSTAFKALTAIN